MTFMTESPVVIYSEKPFDDIWLRLLRFTSHGNLAQHRPRNSGAALDAEGSAEVSASCQQAHEYFRAALSATLATAPLQLYYGMASLLKAATILVNGACGDIGHHGMTAAEIPSGGKIGDVSLVVHAMKAGGLLEYAGTLQPGNRLGGKQSWSLAELLGSVPDLFDEHAAAYGGSELGHCVPIERVLQSDSKIADRIDLTRVPDLENLIPKIEHFSERYLTPQHPAGSPFMILRPRLNVALDITETALSGRRFLLVGHTKEGRLVTLTPVVAMFMGMFILGTLSRYHARRWSSFLDDTQDDERHLVEMSIRMCIRTFPNMALDFIVGRKHVFTGLRFQDTDLREYAVTNDVKEIVSKEVEGVFHRLKRQE